MKDAPRRTAYDVVLAVERDGAYANLLLPRLSRERGLDRRDAAFAAELTYGTLRWQGVLDEVVAAAARRPAETLDPPVRAVLRVGAYQLLHLRTPAHAAVHATVELARAVAGPKPVGFVNAVLRKVSQGDWETWVRRLAPADERGALAFRHGYPLWVVDAIAAALGPGGDLAAALAEDRPVTHLVARPGRVTRDALLAEAGDGAEPGPWSPYAVRLAAGGDPGALPSVRSGAAGVQDEGSQLVALALARAEVTEGGGGAAERWLDMCAGPGGKAALLSGLLPEGGRLLAAELHPHRARLVARALGGPGAVVADGTKPAWAAGAFDRVLVDAPCTGLGALRRRPEVRWRRRPEDVDRLRPLQERLLESALDAARPGGVVAYVTCSPVPAETTEVVAAVVSRRPGTEVVDPRPLLPEVPETGTATHLQLWPHRHGTDAMFLALLRPPRP
ncbi:MAG: rRNA (cytosine967-C5)-methyltransferase [Frankiaceae bacterium]|jgi:16S rRNA (cytosine967-C5)-methyltransferase|nr:rRNA (cytosine967-C5)-methyltransferase [Frankiaceae bacterium]